MTMRLSVPEYIYCYKDKDISSYEDPSRSFFDCHDHEYHRHCSSPAHITADSNRESDNSRERNYHQLSNWDDTRRSYDPSPKYHGYQNWQNHYHRGERSSRRHHHNHNHNYRRPSQSWGTFKIRNERRENFQRGCDVPPSRRNGLRRRNSFQEQPHGRRSYYEKSLSREYQEKRPPSAYHHNGMTDRQRSTLNHSFGDNRQSYSDEQRGESYPWNPQQKIPFLPNRGYIQGDIPSHMQASRKVPKENSYRKWNGRGYPPSSHSRP